MRTSCSAYLRDSMASVRRCHCVANSESKEAMSETQALVTALRSLEHLGVAAEMPARFGELGALTACQKHTILEQML